MDFNYVAARTAEERMDATAECRTLRRWAGSNLKPHFTRREWSAIVSPCGQLADRDNSLVALNEAVLTLTWAGQTVPESAVLPACLPFRNEEHKEAMDWVADTFAPNAAFVQQILSATHLRPLKELWAVRQRAWEDLANLLLGLAGPAIEDLIENYRFPDLQCQVEDLSRQRLALVQVSSRLNALDWVLGLKPNWDEPFFASYGKKGYRDFKIFLD